MTRLSIVFLYLFGLLWGLLAVAGLLLPLVELPDLDRYARLIDIGLGWLTTQALAGFGFALAAAMCAAGRRPLLAALALLAIPCVIALAAASLDPRVAAAVPPEAQGPYNAVRAQLPLIRLGGVLGFLMIGAAAILRRSGMLTDRLLNLLVLPAVVVGWALAGWVQEPIGLIGLALPGLILLAMIALQLAEDDPPGRTHALIASLALLGGLGLLAGGGLRVDLSAAFLVMPLVVLSAVRRAPEVGLTPTWLHALAMVGLIAYLSPTLNALIPRPPPTSLADIRAALAGAETAKINASIALAALTLLALVTIRRRQQRDETDPPAALGAVT